MAYVKHPLHGNKHVADSEVPALVKDGWVKWPRTADEKALGDGSDAAYWRKKYERDVSVVQVAEVNHNLGNLQNLTAHNHFGSADQDSMANENQPARRGRPPKA